MNFSKFKVNYTIIKKKLLYVVHSLNKFRHYIIGYQVFVPTDHATIKYFFNKPDVNVRIIIWFYLLQYFELTIADKLGKEKCVSYLLSRPTMST